MILNKSKCISTIFALQKLVMVLSELIRCSDSIKDPVYPFIGSGSNALAREFALLLIECKTTAVFKKLKRLEY